VPEQPAQEKTELPTPKRLRDAREKGQVSKSQDVNTTGVLVCALFYVAIAWSFYIGYLTKLMVFPALYYGRPFQEGLADVLSMTALVIMLISFPLIVAVMLTAIAVNFFQFGAVFSFEPLKPNLNKINPLEGAKKIFSAKNAFEFVKSAAKVAFLGTLIASILYTSMSSLIYVPYAGINGVLALMEHILKILSLLTILAYAFVAIADYFFQKWQYIKNLKMTKDEVKREHKEMEGDPLIKSKRRALAKEIVGNLSIQKSREASVVITNPTHLAVALFYERDKTKLPVVIAKGEGAIAEQMIQAAREAGVPVMRDVPLAHALHAVEVNQYVPSDLIRPVAEVLRYIAKMKKEGKKP
jgi:type III secretion protein U